MKILLLTQWYHPEPGPRVHELAEELVARGHGVTVVTGFPTYPYEHFYEGYRPRLFRREERQGVKIVRLPHFPHARGSAVRRALNYCSFALSTMTIGNALVKKTDCMYVFMPPPLIGFAAKIISFFHRIPLMYDIQDIWPDAIEASSFKCSDTVKSSLRLVEKIVYPCAKAISVPSAGYKQNLVEKGVAAEKIEVIPNWADENTYRVTPYDKAMAKLYGAEGKFTVVYGGNIGYSQSLQTVVDAAKILSERSDIRFVLAGDGAELSSMKAACEMHGLKNVVFTGRLPVPAMSPLFSIADLLLVHLRDHKAFKMTIPSKTQAYMACGKPILMAVEGDAADLIRRTNSGVVCRPERAGEIADAILKVYGMSLEERRLMAENARLTYVRYFKKSDAVDRYEKLLFRIAGILPEGRIAETCRG